jgi:vesicle-fusing ATPase
MPLQNLHMTTLEITHSRTPQEIQDLINVMNLRVPIITDYTFSHRARLVKPMLSYDGVAIALSFLPAAGEALGSRRLAGDDDYTYHHLRRDLYDLSRGAGVTIESRYTVPSSHLTIGRFTNAVDFSLPARGSGSLIPDPEKMKLWIGEIEHINQWLQGEYWPKGGETPIKEGGEWIVGEEKGLDCRVGALWYGGGETIRLGQGF